MVRMCAEYSDLCNIPDHYNGITDLPDIKVIYFLFSCADAEDSSSSGTIPMEKSARSQAEIEDLCDKYYPGGYADTSPGKEDGCRLWHTNPWALGWSRDM